MDEQARLEELIAKLRDRQYRITPQRIAVLKALLGNPNHPSVEHIYDQLKKDYPTMSLATVYKQVRQLKELGEVLELGFPDDDNRYDGMKPYPHVHLICQKCRKIMDIEYVRMDGIQDTVLQKTGYRWISNRIDIYGLCPDCQKGA